MSTRRSTPRSAQPSWSCSTPPTRAGARRCCAPPARCCGGSRSGSDAPLAGQAELRGVGLLQAEPEARAVVREVEEAALRDRLAGEDVPEQLVADLDGN